MNITIRAAEPADYEAVRQTMSQPNVIRGTMQLPFPAAEMWKKRFAEHAENTHVLVAEVDGKVVGNLGLHPAGNAARRRHAASLGMSVHDAYHGKGVGTALMAAALNLADNWLQYSRVELTVFSDNEAAIALYKKFGFEIEGTFKQYAFRDGVLADAYTMARLKKAI
jgi:L-phenylalanine/L-methionine N-acetyltransferase